MSESSPARRRAAAPLQRVDQQPAFVLHATPWRETSLVLEIFTREHGRVAVVARGAKRPTSQFRGLLTPFSLLALGWSGRGEIKSLVKVEWLGLFSPLRGEGLLAGFYLNELLVRLLARMDPHPSLFAAYADVLRHLAAGEQALAPLLRGFELDLLRDVGWLPGLAETTAGEPVEAGSLYRLDLQQGLVQKTDQHEGLTARGETLLALARRDLSNPQVLADGKHLLRNLIGYHLSGKPLNTRRILQDLRQLELV
jgi:DNA repair protein RecO (recombination protein O)